MCTFTSLWPLHWSPTGAIPSVHWSPIQTHHKLLYVPHISNTQLNPFFSHSSIHRRHAYTRLQTAGGSKHIAAQSTSIQCNVQLCSTFNRNVCINSFVYFCISLALQPATGELPLQCSLLGVVCVAKSAISLRCRTVPSLDGICCSTDNRTLSLLCRLQRESNLDLLLSLVRQDLPVCKWDSSAMEKASKKRD